MEAKAPPERGEEAKLSAEACLSRAQQKEVVVKQFRDGYFPCQLGEIKDEFEAIRSYRPDIVFTHYREDRHQDHRIISDLTALPLPRHPKTTLNVGTIQGGISVNTIAPDVEFLLDLRSVEESLLQHLTAEVERVLNLRRSGIEVRYETIGERPAGVVENRSDGQVVHSNSLPTR